MATRQLEETKSIIVTHERPLRRFAYNSLLHLNNFLLEYWATMLTAILGLVVLIALSIPFLSYFGLDAIAKPLFFSLHYVCAQIPSHSFYIFGHQLGLCARNLSIYSSMFLGSLIFVLSKKRLTGTLFGSGSVWFVLPYMQTTIPEQL